ncbi:MAG: trifunctional transcriptional regulator/proline dehydrogenase/L-glutamate gamma-semialdehyde, partial [Pseudomonadota bacterium]
LYGPARENSPGMDWAHEPSLQALQDALATCDATVAKGDAPWQPATPADVDEAVARAVQGSVPWADRPAAQRARVLREAADRLVADRAALMHLLVHEAGKTWPNAHGEWREAIDFLRFHAAEIEGRLAPVAPGLGPVVCISPWNFPLAIFMGQVSAALAAGHAVLAKPAEQTPQVAWRAVQHLHAAGVPAQALQLLPGDGTVGAALVADPRVAGVLFTGSTEVARLLQRALVGRVGPNGLAVPLVAETGGQNAMVVDSSALPEQVVQDVLTSAFDSAGQRCSALRVLCLQQEVADTVLHMLHGALDAWRVGDPADLATDMGPVIDAEALARLQAHVQHLRGLGLPVRQWPVPEAVGRAMPQAHFMPPTVAEIPSLNVLTHEVFGPVLHVLRYQREELPALLAQIRATGYGLTLGVHSRIGETIDLVRTAGLAGNQYVNRHMVGAVVGVQPFGGEGLSGTGPKAGGPLSLLRLMGARPESVLRPWLVRGADGRVQLAREQPLPGPTGEANTCSLHPVARVLCLADTEADLRVQWRALQALGSQAVWPERWRTVWQQLPEAERGQVQLTAAWPEPGAVAALGVQRVLLHGDAQALAQAQAVLAAMPGPIVSVVHALPRQAQVPLERLVHEVATSNNTAAAGGNAALMALD